MLAASPRATAATNRHARPTARKLRRAGMSDRPGRINPRIGYHHDSSDVPALSLRAANEVRPAQLRPSCCWPCLLWSWTTSSQAHEAICRTAASSLAHTARRRALQFSMRSNEPWDQIRQQVSGNAGHADWLTRRSRFKIDRPPSARHPSRTWQRDASHAGYVCR